MLTLDITAVRKSMWLNMLIPWAPSWKYKLHAMQLRARITVSAVVLVLNYSITSIIVISIMDMFALTREQ